MTYQDLEFFKRTIMKKLAQYIDAPNLREKLFEPSDQPIEIIERANNEVERDLYLTLRRRVDDQITELRDAFDRVNDKNYGICLSCGEDIPVKRLLAQPTTRFCVQCQEEKERKERFLRNTAESYENESNRFYSPMVNQSGLESLTTRNGRRSKDENGPEESG